MRLHEYQSKEIFSKYQIPVPKSRLVSTPHEAKSMTEELGAPVVLKAQVLVGGRGKAGGIRLVKSAAEAEENVSDILSRKIKDIPVRRVLVEKAVDIKQEIYIGLTIDRRQGSTTLIASGEGGIDIEEIALQTPEKISRTDINPLLGLHNFQIRNIATEIELPRELWRSFTTIIQNLYQVFRDHDATLVEINPLVITTDNQLVALDGKMMIDDNALFRHPDFLEKWDISAERPAEVEARKFCLAYIKLDGNIGCLVNGAGLAMATMDIIQLKGGQPANFLDIGGGASAEKVAAALRIILTDPQVESVLINIFGGITRCDEVAHGILLALENVQTDIPFVVRLIGTNEEEGRRILSHAALVVANTLQDAAEKAIALAKERAA